MDALASCRLVPVAVLVVSFSTIYARWEEATMEAAWKRFHPKPRHLPNRWNEAYTLTHEQHRRICDDVAYQIMDHNTETIKNYTYVNATDIQKERVSDIPVEFQHGIGDTLPLTLITCRYEQKEFYLAQADEDTVFRMIDDPDRGVIFKSGPHHVLYDPYKWGEKKGAAKEVHIPSMLKG